MIARYRAMFRFFFTNILMMLLAIYFLAHFILIAISGEVVISEPNTAVLAAEIMAMIGILIFAIANIIHFKRR